MSSSSQFGNGIEKLKGRQKTVTSLWFLQSEMIENQYSSLNNQKIYNSSLTMKNINPDDPQGTADLTKHHLEVERASRKVSQFW